MSDGEIAGRFLAAVIDVLLVFCGWLFLLWRTAATDAKHERERADRYMRMWEESLPRS